MTQQAKGWGRGGGARQREEGQRTAHFFWSFIPQIVRIQTARQNPSPKATRLPMVSGLSGEERDNGSPHLIKTVMRRASSRPPSQSLLLLVCSSMVECCGEKGQFFVLVRAISQTGHKQSL